MPQVGQSTSTIQRVGSSLPADQTGFAVVTRASELHPLHLALTGGIAMALSLRDKCERLFERHANET
jgi:hypothetical protein